MEPKPNQLEADTDSPDLQINISALEVHAVHILPQRLFVNFPTHPARALTIPIQYLDTSLIATHSTRFLYQIIPPALWHGTA